MSRMRTNKLLRGGGNYIISVSETCTYNIYGTKTNVTPVIVTTTVSSVQTITQLQQFDEIYENTSLLE